MKTYYLVPVEGTPYGPLPCQIIRRLKNTVRDDLALVDLKSPIPKSVYCTNEEVRKVILATCQKGKSLFNNLHLPISVYICSFTDAIDFSKEFLGDSDLSLIDKGLLCETEEEAREHIVHPEES
ncbi:MAG: hypothetical protein WCU88_02745 [Elusimicrobiota bacterium]|jgi:hypothetical protein